MLHITANYFEMLQHFNYFECTSLPLPLPPQPAYLRLLMSVQQKQYTHMPQKPA